MSNFFKRHTPLFDNPSSFQKLNPGECCIDDVFLSDAVIALNGAVWELTLTLNDGTTHVAPLPPTFTDIYVVSFARHPDALTDPAFVNTIRITLSDLTVFDLDLTFLVAGGEDLAATLVLGNITGGLDIELTLNDVIKGVGTTNEINLNATGAWQISNDAGANLTSYVYGDATSAYLAAPDCFFIADVNRINLYHGGAGFINKSVSRISITGIGIYDKQLVTTGYNFHMESVAVSSATSAALEQVALFLNSGGSAVSTSNIGISNSIALGGSGLTINTDDTAYANQISLQQSGNAFNTFIIPSPVTVSDKIATIQDKTGTLAYLSDIPSGTAINNIYNVDGTLQADRFIDGNSRTHRITFFDLLIFQVSTTDLVSIEPDILQIGGITSVSIGTPNTIAALGKVGQVLKLNTTIGGCDWEEKYFAVNLDVGEAEVVVANSGSNWTYTVTHNLDSLDIKPEIFRLSDGASVGAGIKRINVNEVTVRIKSGPNPNNLYRIII